MTRKETTKILSELTEKLINPFNDSRIYWAKETTLDYFIGDYNYYIMPVEVYAAVSLEVSYAVGVYCPEGTELHSVKKAKGKNRERPVSEMLLIMFRSAARDHK